MFNSSLSFPRENMNPQPSPPEPSTQSAESPPSPFVPRTYAPRGRIGFAIGGWKHAGAIFGLLAAASALRLIDLDGKGLWYDEILTLTHDANPLAEEPQYELFFFFTRLFKFGSAQDSIAARLYPALAGLIGVALVYFFVSRLYSRFAGLLAALVLCLNPFHLFCSQEARPYAPVMMYATLALWCAARLASTRSWRRFLWLPVIGAAAVLGALHDPAAKPFMLILGVGMMGSVVFTRWGCDAVRQIIPPLQFGKAMRWVTPAVWLGAMALGIDGLWRWRAEETRAGWEQIQEALSILPQSAPFFIEHLKAFAWGLSRHPILENLVMGLTLIFCVIGWGALAVRGFYWAVLFLLLFLAAWVGVSIHPPADGNLLFHTAYLQPLLASLFGVGFAVVAGWIVRSNPGLSLTWRRRIMVGAAAVVILLFLPGDVSYYRADKTPLARQLRYLQANNGAKGEIYVYGRSLYPAVLAVDDLPEGSRLVYLPATDRPGRLEAQLLANRTEAAYFLDCGAGALPPELKKMLVKNPTFGDAFPSILDPEHDGTIYALVHAEASLPPYWPAAFIDGIETPARPEIVQNEKGEWINLRFDGPAKVRYPAILAGASQYRIEVEVRAEKEGEYYLAFQTEGGDRLILGGRLKAGQDAAWRGDLTAHAERSHLLMSYLAQWRDSEDPDGGLIVKRIHCEPGSSVKIEPAGEIDFTPPRRHAYPYANASGLMTGWAIEPFGSLMPRVEPKGRFLTVRIGKHELSDLKRAEIISPFMDVKPGELLWLRTEARIDQAHGFSATIVLYFRDREGNLTRGPNLAGEPMRCRRKIEGWTRAFGSRPWVEFQGVLRIPEGIERVAPALRIERMAGEKVDHGVEGEVQWRPVEISIPGPSEPVIATEKSEGEAPSPVPEPVAVEPMESKPESEPARPKPDPVREPPDDEEFSPRPGELLPEREIPDSAPEDSHS